MKVTSLALPLATLSALVLAACGGGGGGGSSTSSTTTSTTQASSLSGVVQGKGSVVINGIRCSTTGARIADDDGKRYSTDQVEIGYVVTSDCEYDDNTKSGQASAIVLKREFAGPVDTVGASSFTLLGQTIQITANTLFKGDSGATASSLSDIKSGDFVEVYGLPKGNGIVEATHVEKNGSVSGLSSGVEGRGEALNVNNTAKTFTIGNLSVDYSAAPNAGTITLTEGQLVRFKSTNLPVYSGGSATLAATTLQTRSIRSEYDPNNDGKAEIKGYVESDAGDNNANTFVIGGVLVDISNLSTSAKSLFTTNSLLEVKGTFTGNTLVATKAERENDRVSSSGGRYEFYGVATNGSFTNNTLTFDIQNYRVTFNRDACGIGGGATPYVEVKGNLSNGVITASKIECKSGASSSGSSSSDSDREFSGNRFELSGSVSNYDRAAREFTLRDIRVRITDTTRFEDGATEALMQNGRRVEVKGALDGNSVMIAEKIEFED